MPRLPHRRRSFLSISLLLAAALIASCAPADRKVIAKSSDFLVVSAGAADTLGSLAADYLGGASNSWVISDFNDITRVRPGQEVVIPLRPLNRAALYTNGYRKVPVLTYHRFTPRGQRCDRLAVSGDSFAGQLAYLRDRGFTMISFRQLADFLEGKGPIPRRPVILTIDDGYRSSYDVAYPVLREYGAKATMFVYSDFIGVSTGLTWSQMREMVGSGLVDIQPHSKSHSDLSRRLEGESDAQYRRRLKLEVTHPARLIKKNLKVPIHTFAYPYGAENDAVVKAVKDADYRLAVTVTRGGNPSFAHPYVLRRTQIYCDDDIETFAKRLDIFERMAVR